MDTTKPLSDPTDPQFGLTAQDSAALAARYEILREVGRGGMGVVYEARHRALDMRVAIKITLPGSEIERFLREARLLARVKSSHVVAVHDFEILPNGCPMLVMEWVEGTDLRKTLEAAQGPLAEDVVLPWMRHTNEGMLAAEGEGIVHRDLKPSNILIDRRQQARVADFGLARGPVSLGELTRSGGAMGTPYYMAPEQAEDPRAVDVRADIYSFGATFYHALTGCPPFEGPTTFAVLYKHKTEPLISPRARNPHLSERLSELLERCLAKSPGDRFASFADVRKHLQPAADGPSPWDRSDDAELAGYLKRYQARRDLYLSGRMPWDFTDIYEFPRGQTLKIVRGDIVAQPVDVIVSSDNCWLTLDYGVSLAVRRAAGETVRREAQRFTPVLPGRVVVTAAGNLKARLIFHAVSNGMLLDGYPIPASRDIIAEIMASCFYHAQSHPAVTSIAFPLFGTGGAGFSREVCLDTMFQCLGRVFLRGLTSIREARIVIFE